MALCLDTEREVGWCGKERIQFVRVELQTRLGDADSNRLDWELV